MKNNLNTIPISLEDKNIVERVLNELSKLCSVPNEGFLAGGAVANTILSLKYGKDYPINDLDIFIEGNLPDDRLVSTPLRTNSLIIREGYYGNEIGYDHGSNYKIIKVSRDGLLNYITITKVNDRENIKDYQYVLNGFDFNCCQVGIDLSNNQIYYTEEFEKFLNTQQLDITALYTPAHTAIRLFKKVDELGCYCDVNKCMEILSLPLIGDVRIHLNSRQFAFYFSHKYKDMFMKYYKEIKPYFTMVRFFDDKKHMWKMRNDVVFNTSSSLDKHTVPEGHAVTWMDPSRSIPQEMLRNWSKYNDIMWTLSPKIYNTPNKDIINLLKSDLQYGSYQFSPISFISAYKIIAGGVSKKMLLKYNKVIENGVWTKLLTLLNFDFCKCDFTIDHINYIEESIKNNDFIAVNILKYKLSLQESYLFCKTISKITKKEGEWISPLIKKALDDNNSLIKPTYDNLINIIKKEKEKHNKPLIESVKIIDKLGLPSNVIVKELITEIHLNWAGTKLKNCINDPGQKYSKRIKEGVCKLFVIMTDASCSALELHVTTNKLSYKEKYLLSSCNQEPTRYHRIIADIIINELNADLLRREYENKIKTYKNISMLNRGLLIECVDNKDSIEKEERDPVEWATTPLFGRRGGIIGEQRVAEAALGDDGINDDDDLNEVEDEDMDFMLDL